MRNTIKLGTWLGTVALMGVLSGCASESAGESGGGEASLVKEVRETSSSTTQSLAYPKTYLNTVIDQWTHWSPDYYASSHAGTLYKGSNYFFCWTVGVSYYGPETGRTSNVWLLTDDDNHHRNVYVNDVYLDDWGWVHDTDVLPHC